MLRIQEVIKLNFTLLYASIFDNQLGIDFYLLHLLLTDK